MALKSDGTVYVDTRVDTKGFNKGMNTVENRINGLGGSFKKLGVAIAAAFSIKQLIEFSKKSIELGSDLQEVENVVNTVFTTMSDQVDEFAKGAAEAAGLSETMAKRYVGTFGSMAKAFGFAESEAFTMSTTLTQLAGDVASFYNLTQDESYTKLKSVFTGETESLKDLGVVMTQTALDSFALSEGFGKTTKQMSEQEKVALRYAFVLDKLSDASGDFQKTSSGWANQMRILKLNIESIMAAFGQALINFFTPIIKVINVLLGKIVSLANAFKSFSEMIMGVSSGSSESNVKNTVSDLENLKDGYGGIAEGAEAAASATEKADKANKKYLSGLDKLNVITTSNETSAGNIGGGGIIGEPPINFEPINKGGEKTNTIFDDLIEKLKELAEIFKAGFIDGLGDFQKRIDTIKKSLASIKKSLISIFNDPKVKKSAEKYIKSFVYMLGQMTGSIASIGLTIATNLTAGFAKYLEENEGRIKDYLVSMFDIGTEKNKLIGNFSSSFAYIFEEFSEEAGQEITANLIELFANSFMEISELSAKLGLDILSAILQPVVDSKEELRNALGDLLEGFEEFTDSINEILNDSFDFVGQIYDEFVSPIFETIKEELTTFYQNSIAPLATTLGEFFGSVGEDLSKLWNDLLKPIIQWIVDNVLPVLQPIFEGIIKRISKLFTTISGIVQNLIKSLGGLIKFITGSFTGDWERAWEGVKDRFSGIFNSLVLVIEGFVNAAIVAINGLISSVNEISSNLGIPAIPTIPEVDLPMLASGAVIPPNAPFAAILGDQKHGNNIEAPESLIRQIMREELAQIGVNVTFEVEGDPNGIFKVTQNKAREYTRRTGAPAF